VLDDNHWKLSLITDDSDLTYDAEISSASGTPGALTLEISIGALDNGGRLEVTTAGTVRLYRRGGMVMVHIGDLVLTRITGAVPYGNTEVLLPPAYLPAAQIFKTALQRSDGALGIEAAAGLSTDGKFMFSLASDFPQNQATNPLRGSFVYALSESAKRL
jgi:hypothetical protein